ncbi:MAG: NTP transferase domain-containing protein [Bacteroidales bacterium]|nr:NTP transferase domain-containing protein [Bacteroidales bacterium]MCF8327083.1 NTP transferase domain-containing protein [Bacteroidales bacterium]
MSKENNYAIIMAGGVGSRFWPWSRSNRPKQFLDILDTGKTLIEQTFDRLKNICEPENIMIVTNERYKEDILQLVPEMQEDNILLEPMMRNTAPCIAYGAYKIQKQNPEARIIVAPSDHLVMKEDVFTHVIKSGFEFASRNNVLLTIGIKPHRPETGYGYIKAENETTEQENDQFSLHPVIQFTEKPDYETAKEFVASGNYYWNSGMFIWSVESILKAFDAYLPDMNVLFQSYLDKFNTAMEHKAIESIYESCETVSIDYGIMEKADNVHVLCTDIGWSDIGTWGSLYEHSKLDENNNAIRGEKVILDDTINSVIKVSNEKATVIQGLKDYIVVDDEKALLICRKKDEQKIKDYVKRVKQNFGEDFI